MNFHLGLHIVLLTYWQSMAALGTTEYRGVVPRLVPWLKTVSTTHHYCLLFIRVLCVRSSWSDVGSTVQYSWWYSGRSCTSSSEMNTLLRAAGRRHLLIIYTDGRSMKDRTSPTTTEVCVKIVSASIHPFTRASEAGGMQGIWHPNYLCGGDIDMYIP